MKLSAIKKNPENPRQIRGEQFERLKKSIKEFPEMMALRPIVVDAEGVTLGGNMRLEALKALGYKEIPPEWVKRASELTEAQRREFAVKDNAGFGEWDWDLLANGWSDLPLAEWGVDLPEDWLDPKGGTEEGESAAAELVDQAAELQKKWDTKSGQLWTISSKNAPGRKHRLLVGDGTRKRDVGRLCADEQASCVFTDPPYGVSARGGRSGTAKKLHITPIVNDELRGEELQNFIASALSLIPLTHNASFYVCYDHKTQHEFTGALRSIGWRQRSTIVWNKHVFGLSAHKGYRPKHELIAFGHVGEDYDWLGGNDQADVWDVQRPLEREGGHPTPKPVELSARALRNSCPQGEIVVDTFIGSGATMAGAEETGRVCYGMEIEPKYCAVTLERMERLGLSPELVK